MPNLDPSNIRTWGDLQFMRVPAGKFLMGSPAANHLADSGERPQHMVEVPYDYWIARYPVTNEQFAEFVTAAKYEFNQGRWQAKADHPVVAMSWRDALAYCQWLARFTRCIVEVKGTFTNWITTESWDNTHGPATAGNHEPTLQFEPGGCGQSGGKPKSVSQSSVPKSIPAIW